MSGWSRAKLVCCLELSECRKWPNHFAQKWAQPDKGGQNLSKGMVRAISWATFSLLLTPGSIREAHRTTGASEVVKAGQGMARNDIHHL